ncbi:MAG: hypothetical protein MJ225_00655 [Bacilli bacterium]|nr:hypothetical protein [Bacilli bacterium]
MKKLLLFLLMIPAFCLVGSNTPKEAKSLENNLVLLVNSKESDEFLDYWENDFRKTPTCDVKYEDFMVMITKYQALSSADKEIVDNTTDVRDGCKIKEVITTLVNRFYRITPQNTDKKDTLTKSTTIIIIVSVAVFGMSTISVFFILKNKKVID